MTDPNTDGADDGEKPPAAGGATVILVRHGLTAATGGTLVGRTPGIALDERGRAQAERLGRRLSAVPLHALVTSPLLRCTQTAEAIAAANPDAPAPRVEERVQECDYGDWTGRRLADLAKEPQWPVVQRHPSAARFPGGESLADVSHRATAAVRAWNAELARQHTHPVYVVCSHGDVIKAILADALGMHLDVFQRLMADPCSVSVIHYTGTMPLVWRINDTGEDFPGFAGDGPPTGEAVVGGGAGHGGAAHDGEPDVVSPPAPDIA